MPEESITCEVHEIVAALETASGDERRELLTRMVDLPANLRFVVVDFLRLGTKAREERRELSVANFPVLGVRALDGERISTRS